MKIAFFETKGWQKSYLKRKLKKFSPVFFNEPLNLDNVQKVKNFEIVSIFIGSMINKEIIKKLPCLRQITTMSTGFDHIDLKECKKRKIAVCNVPFYGENTVAEHTFALILNLSRKIFKSFDQIKETGSFSLKGLQGFDLKDKVLGVIGTGNIGRYVIGIAKGFQMKILAFDAYPDKVLAENLGFQYVKNLDELLTNSDVITLHIPFNSRTRHLINKNNIYKIKKGALLINTSRGGIIETGALLEALKKKYLGGAGLDVLEGEKTIKEELEIFTSDKCEVYDLVEGYQAKEEDLKVLIQNRLLINMENVIITPHSAFYSKEALLRILDTTIENIKAFCQKKLINLVKI